jgi:hypothetical protein
VTDRYQDANKVRDTLDNIKKVREYLNQDIINVQDLKNMLDNSKAQNCDYGLFYKNRNFFSSNISRLSNFKNHFKKPDSVS